MQSMHYPEAYSNLADCQWIIHAPENNVVKVQEREDLLISTQSVPSHQIKYTLSLDQTIYSITFYF